MLVKVKSALSAQLEEQRIIADDESKERQALLGKYRHLEREVDGAQDSLLGPRRRLHPQRQNPSYTRAARAARVYTRPMMMFVSRARPL